MEQKCDLCSQIFESTQIWAIENNGEVSLKSYCEACVDKKITEVSRPVFEKIIEHSQLSLSI